MNPKLKLNVCEQYIHLRENEYSILHSIKISMKMYLLLIVCMIIIWSITGLNDTIKVCMTSFLIGAVIRDVGWFRQIKALWPLTKELIDWEKVEELKKECENEKQK